MMVSEQQFIKEVESNSFRNGISKGKSKKFCKRNYMNYFKKANGGKCLIKNCRISLSPIWRHCIKKHYHTHHNMVILYGLKDEEIMGIQEVNDIQAKNFVVYNKKAAYYQCLFINCKCNLELDVDIVKRHYKEIHEIILKDGRPKFKAHQKNIHRDVEDDKPHCSNSLINSIKCSYINLKHKCFRNYQLTHYADYNKEENISKCLIKDCQRIIRGLDNEHNLKNHYRLMHNMNIGLNIPLEEDEELSDELGEQQAYIQIKDFIVCDNETSYKCLFYKCNHVLENYLPTIKKHYLQKHFTIIGKNSAYLIYKKRKINKLHCPKEKSYISEHDSIPVENELYTTDKLKSQCNGSLDREDLFHIKDEHSSDSDTSNTPDKQEIMVNNKKSQIQVYQKYINTDDENDEIHCPKSPKTPPRSCYINVKRKSFRNFESTNYIDYNREVNTSKCSIANCCQEFNKDIDDEYHIKSHYRLVHKMNIGFNISLQEDEELSVERGGQSSIIEISDFVACDKESSSSYRCLFFKCNKVLENSIHNIKKHYLDKHFTIIGKNSEDLIYKKHKINNLHSLKESDTSDNDSISTKDEFYTDDELTSQCNEERNSSMGSLYAEVIFPIKEEYSNDSEII